MKKLLALLTVAALAFSALAVDLSVGGSGTTAQTGQASKFGTEIRLEQFVTTNVSVGIAQGLQIATPSVRGTSELFATYNVGYTLLKVKNQAYVGASGRIGYGNGGFVSTAGPLVGNRLFLKDNVYLFTQANYDVGLSGNVDNNVRYSVGLGARF